MFAKNKGLPINQNCSRYSTRMYPSKDTVTGAFGLFNPYTAPTVDIKNTIYTYGVEGGYYTDTPSLSSTRVYSSFSSKILDSIAFDGTVLEPVSLLEYTPTAYSFIHMKNFIFDRSTPTGTVLLIKFYSANYTLVSIANGPNFTKTDAVVSSPSGTLTIVKTSYGVDIQAFNVFDKFIADPIKVNCSSYVPFLYNGDQQNGIHPLGIISIYTNYRRR